MTNISTNISTNTADKTEKAATTGTHLIYTRHTGPRSFERKEGTFIITRGHRIKIAEKPEDIVAGDKPVIPMHLAKDIVEAGHGEFYSKPDPDPAPSSKDSKATEEPKKEG